MEDVQFAGQDKILPYQDLSSQIHSLVPIRFKSPTYIATIANPDFDFLIKTHGQNHALLEKIGTDFNTNTHQMLKF